MNQRVETVYENKFVFEDKITEEATKINEKLKSVLNSLDIFLVPMLAIYI